MRVSDSTGSKSSFYGEGYVNKSKIESAMDTHGNELLGEREIGFMSDFEVLDDAIDQTHGKLKWWEGAFVAHNSQFSDCALSMHIAHICKFPPSALSIDEKYMRGY